MAEPQVNILIVDDRPEHLLAMSSILQSPDYRITTANSGEEALRQVMQESFALILMDIEMPGMNGFETVRMLKSQERYRSIPVIFVTALSQATEHMVRGYEIGAIDFIFKPVQPVVLKVKVGQFAGIYRDREQLKAQKELVTRRTIDLEQAHARLLDKTDKLRQMEAMARAISETSTDAFLTVDAQGTILSANPAVRPMFRYSPEELIGKPVWLAVPYTEQLFGSGDGGSLLPVNGTGEAMDVTAVRRSGGTFPAELQIGSACIGDRPIYVCSVRDVTERKMQYIRMEQAVEQRTYALREANGRLQAEIRRRHQVTEQLLRSYDRINDILESITDAFYALDHDGAIVYMNRSAEQRLRIVKEQALGRPFWDYAPVERSKCYDLFLRAALEQAPQRAEFYSNLTESWVEVRAFPSSLGISLYIQDTNERRRMEQDARESQERFYTIFQATPCLMAIQSLNDRAYLDVNESWMKYTGYTYEEMTSGAADLQMTLIPDEGTVETAPVDFAQTMADVKVQYVTKAGERRTGLLSTEIIETPDVPCVLAVITDITDREALEREIARLDRLHMIGEMAAGIAHEIRNPMTTVRGFLQLMRAKKTLPPKDIIDVMVEELNRANGIISEFLALAKNKTTDRRPQNLAQVIEAIGPLIQAEATLAGKQLHLRLDSCPELELDEKEIRQMVLNLALNGLEAMEAGGRLEIATYTEESEVVLEVCDQGHGMDKDVLAKVGTPFFTTKERGTGLGLAVCFSIAARHGAKLTWQTGPEGTAFYVRFAVQPEPAAENDL